MANFGFHNFAAKNIVFTAAGLVLLAAPAIAQSSTDGWQDLESLIPQSSASPAAPDASEGWQDLESYEGRLSSSSEAPANSASSDGWQDIESLTPDSNTAVDSSSGWIDIEDELAAASTDLNLPTAVLSAGDLIDITVAKADDINGAYRISSIGTVFLPLIGSVNAVGLSPAELEDKLEQLYEADYLVNPKITVTTREKIIGQVSFEGLISRTGPVSLTPVDTLTSLLSKAGGVSGESANLDAIILRKLENTVSARRVSLNGIVSGDTRGPTILPGDQIRILDRGALPKIKEESGKYPLLDKVLSGGTLRNF